MARKVFRYGPLEIVDGPQMIHMPVNAKIVHTGRRHNGYIDIWAVTDEDASLVTAPRIFQVYETGQPLPEDAQYLDTTIHTETTLIGVWHVFERLAD